MNINQMGLRYNIKGEMVNMEPKEIEKAMMNKKALLKPLRRAAWLRHQDQKAA